jgi:ATP-dependent DNA helicase PIF1
MITGMAETKVEINDGFRVALRVIEETRDHVFVTGRAGTGKSTLLEHFRDRTRKSIAVLAPTGVAAVNVGGQTIHSFFSFRPGITVDAVRRRYGRKSRVYKELDAVVIDEVSMVRADLLDCVDRFLRLNGPRQSVPFGGVQMIFIGDPYQLPPVVSGEEEVLFRAGEYASPYFFDALAFQNLSFHFIELEKVYRQEDPGFVELLDAVRTSCCNDAHLARINARLVQSFRGFGRGYVHLTTRTFMADEINARMLGQLRGRAHAFQGSLSGEFPENRVPTALHLVLKRGAQVMLLNNDAQGRWVNGDLGEVVMARERGGGHVEVRLFDGSVERVTPYMWEQARFVYDERSRRVVSEVVGRFTQYPLRLAWAVTIHKGQGKTFDRVVVDFGHGAFAPGQAYVALSRCRSLEGLALVRPLESRHVFTDSRVDEFMQRLRFSQSKSV